MSSAVQVYLLSCVLRHHTFFGEAGMRRVPLLVPSPLVICMLEVFYSLFDLQEHRNGNANSYH